MKREDIFRKLNLSGFDRNRIIIISGASLVIQGVIEETSDIDLSCDTFYYKGLPFYEKIGSFGKSIKCMGVFEISDNLYYPYDIVLIDGYKCMSIEKCLEIKVMLNRKKDEEVIKKLRKICER